MKNGTTHLINPVVNFELACLLKEKDFNWKTRQAYDGDPESNYYKSYKSAWTQNACWSLQWTEKYLSNPYFIPAPTHQVIQLWFKQTFNIDVWAQPYIVPDSKSESLGDLDGTYSYYIYKDGKWITDGCDFESLEEAFTVGIENALKQI